MEDGLSDYDRWAECRSCKKCNGSGGDGNEGEPIYVCGYCNGTGIEPGAFYGERLEDDVI